MRSSKQGTKAMTTITSKPQKSFTIASVSAMAMLVSVTAGVVSNVPESDPAWRAPVQISRAQPVPVIARDQQPQLRADVRDQLGALEASGLVRCIMPPAWQKDCKASTMKIAAN
jgi:hypothetical protein